MSQNYDRSLFGEIEKFVKMKLLGETYEVPDRLELLRVFQFLDFEIDYARLCWNGSCHRCVVTLKNGEKIIEGLSCRLKSCEGGELTKIPPTIKPRTQVP